MKNNKTNFKQYSYDSHFDLIYRPDESIDFHRNLTSDRLESYKKYSENTENSD